MGAVYSSSGPARKHPSRSVAAQTGHIPLRRRPSMPATAPGMIARFPIRFGAVSAIAYGVFASFFVFAGHVGGGDFIWIGLLSVAAGLAGWVIALGRRVDSIFLVLCGLGTLLMPGASSEVPPVADLLGAIGLEAVPGSWWRWVETGEPTATMRLTPGVLAMLLMGTGCAILGWRARQRPPKTARRIHPLIPAAFAAGMPVLLAIGPGYDPAVTPLLVAYAALVGMGAAAITVGAHRRQRGLVVSGWITVAGLPGLHALGLVTPAKDTWAPTMLYDLVGVLVTISAAAAALIGLVNARKHDRRDARLESTGEER